MKRARKAKPPKASKPLADEVGSSKEINALQAALWAIKPLQKAARQRVLQYLQRFANDSNNSDDDEEDDY